MSLTIIALPIFLIKIEQDYTTINIIIVLIIEEGVNATCLGKHSTLPLDIWANIGENIVKKNQKSFLRSEALAENFYISSKFIDFYKETFNMRIKLKTYNSVKQIAMVSRVVMSQAIADSKRNHFVFAI